MSGTVKERPILYSAPMVRAKLAGIKTQTRRLFKPEMIKIETHPSGGYYYHTFAKRSGEIVCTGQGGFIPENWLHYCPFGKVGDRLYGREKWCSPRTNIVGYAADAQCGAWFGDGCGNRIWHNHGYILNCDAYKLCFKEGFRTWGILEYGGKWRPSIHMPRWASRILDEIVEIRVERVQDISEADAIAEGCDPYIEPRWWEGYRVIETALGVQRFHQQEPGDKPPAWMTEPHPIDMPWLNRSAKQGYRNLWDSINGKGSWESNPWVWVITTKTAQP